MPVENWVGITVSGSRLDVVRIQVKNIDASLPLVLEDFTWNLQKGGRPQSYCVMHERVRNYLSEHGIEYVAIKESSASRTMSLSHLHAAELRGVVMAAASSVVSDIRTVNKGVASRTFGERKVDSYISDDSFWAASLDGDLRKGSREAAFIVIVAREQ